MKSENNFSYRILPNLRKDEPFKSLLEQINSEYEEYESFPLIKDDNIEIHHYNRFVFFLCEYEVKAMNRLTNNEELIDRNKILNQYCIGFIAGLEFFKNTYSTNILFDNNSNLDYAKVLHEKYYHANINGFNDGWIKFLRYNPIAFNEKTIFDIGYYTGMIHSTNELIDINPILFNDFHVCKHYDLKYSVDTNNKTTKQIIDNINGINKDNWKNYFSSEIDYNNFLYLFTLHFEIKDDNTNLDIAINLKQGKLTSFSGKLKYIHNDIGNVTLSKDNSFFDKVRKINLFKELDNLTIKNKMQKH